MMSRTSPRPSLRRAARLEREYLLNVASELVAVAPTAAPPQPPSPPARRGFVVAVLGNVAELTPEVDALLGAADVLLLQAPAGLDDGREEAAAAAAAAARSQRLRGFYPVRVEHDGTGVRVCQMPAPAAPDH